MVPEFPIIRRLSFEFRSFLALLRAIGSSPRFQPWGDDSKNPESPGGRQKRPVAPPGLFNMLVPQPQA